jgi:hypothetical protein
MWLVHGVLVAGLGVLALLGALVLVLLVLQALSLWRVRKVPGPRAWPLLGTHAHARVRVRLRMRPWSCLCGRSCL